jgi:hypothetical protein
MAQMRRGSQAWQQARSMERRKPSICAGFTETDRVANKSTVSRSGACASFRVVGRRIGGMNGDLICEPMKKFFCACGLVEINRGHHLLQEAVKITCCHPAQHCFLLRFFAASVFYLINPSAIAVKAIKRNMPA